MRGLPKIEIRFIFEGERYIARLGRDDAGKPIELFLDGGHLHRTAAQLTSQLLQHGVDVKHIRSSVYGRPLVILLDRIIAMQGNMRQPSPARSGPGPNGPTAP
jgi:hypothetical protein